MNLTEALWFRLYDYSDVAAPPDKVGNEYIIELMIRVVEVKAQPEAFCEEAMTELCDIPEMKHMWLGDVSGAEVESSL